MFLKQGRNDLRLLFLGDGARKAELKADAVRRGLTNVIFVDSVPKVEVVRYWSLLNVSIIHLRDTDLFSTVIPSKMFESMGMGIPLLHGVPGESAGIVEREGVGIVFPSGNHKALCDAMLLLKDDTDRYAQLRQRCIDAAPNYDRSRLAGEMLTVLDAVRRKSSRSHGQLSTP
jgi:glycosyltransferase involved in cell wall biosynthesis